ncbi:MAG: DedA family protein [Oleibacter sp.]|nr:DedA family protein [Thalassolituus sp.]
MTESIMAMFSSDSQSHYFLLAAVAAVSLIESLAVIGLLVPGVALLIALTLMAVEAQVPAWSWWLAGTLGALVGDGISYRIGVSTGPSLKYSRIFLRHPNWWVRGEVFFLRYGIWGLVIGRFVGPLRPIVPIIAGALGMSGKKFWLTNIVSAPLWAVAYLMTIYFIGAGLSQILTRSQALWLLAAATLLAILVTLWLKRR